MASSGSPLADKASKRLSASKNPSCPIIASANQNLTHQIRIGREKQLFFEVPLSSSSVAGDKSAAREGRRTFSGQPVNCLTSGAAKNLQAISLSSAEGNGKCAHGSESPSWSHSAWSGRWL